MSTPEDRLAALTAQVRRELAALSYPHTEWVRPFEHRSGAIVHDVVIIGGGQSGLCAAFHLMSEGVSRVLVLDQAPAGFEGPWATFARMERLRTPRYMAGLERGLYSLSSRAWFETKYGAEAWAALDRIPRQDWMAYLRWYRHTLDLPVRNNARVTSIAPDGACFALGVETPSGGETVLARRVILATGYDSNGAWHIPEFLSEALPPEVCRHSNHVIDFDALRGKRIGILGHGASAFDTALAALRHGAHSVDLCFRRRDLPRVNPHRWAEFAGFLKHFPELDDATRWAVAHFFDTADQPPARHSFDAACAQAHLKIHAATPWTRASYEGGAIHIETPSGAFVFDQVIAATGSKADLHLRRELRDIVDGIALWRDRYTPSEDLAHPALGHYPYLGHHYEFTAREPGAAPYLTHLYAYNFSSFVSCGPHSTSISGHKHALPRLIRGVTGSLFREQSASLLPSVKAYDEVELDLPVRDIAPRTGIQL